MFLPWSPRITESKSLTMGLVSFDILLVSFEHFKEFLKILYRYVLLSNNCVMLYHFVWNCTEIVAAKYESLAALKNHEFSLGWNFSDVNQQTTFSIAPGSLTEKGRNKCSMTIFVCKISFFCNSKQSNLSCLCWFELHRNKFQWVILLAHAPMQCNELVAYRCACVSICVSVHNKKMLLLEYA